MFQLCVCELKAFCKYVSDHFAYMYKAQTHGGTVQVHIYFWLFFFNVLLLFSLSVVCCSVCLLTLFLFIIIVIHIFIKISFHILTHCICVWREQTFLSFQYTMTEVRRCSCVIFLRDEFVNGNIIYEVRKKEEKNTKFFPNHSILILNNQMCAKRTQPYTKA